MHAYTRTHGEALTHTDTHTHTRSHGHTHTDTRTRTHTLWPFWFKLPEAPNNFFWLYPVLNVVTSCLLLAFMAPHVTPQELADLRAWAAQGLAPTEIHKRHRKSRRQQRNKLKPLCLTALRKALLGVTHRNIARQMPIKTRRERVYFSLCHLVDTPWPMQAASMLQVAEGTPGQANSIAGMSRTTQGCEATEPQRKPIWKKYTYAPIWACTLLLFKPALYGGPFLLAGM